MSFSIKLQRNKSEANKIGKSLTDISTVSGTLRDGTSILNPVILILGDISDYTHCNYMTISAFDRKYFITDIRSIRNGVFEISGKVDVLETYKDQIKNNKAIIKKQEKVWNLYLNDGTFHIFQNQQIVTKNFPHGFSGQEVVLAVAGSSGS